MKTSGPVIAVGVVLMVVGLSAEAAAQTQHVLETPAEAKWGAPPPMLPAGAQAVVLEGDPSKPAPFTVRAKMPANYAIPAHSHPGDEHVVVTSGALTFGMGDKLDKGAPTNKTLPVGGFALMPANMNHFVYTTQETTIVVYGMGPMEFKYVNPADDPRTAQRPPKE